LQRATPTADFTQADLPPLQQFCEAPRPPQTSPSGVQLPKRWQRRSPCASGAPHDPEQQSLSVVQKSWYGLQPPIG
jgi:hypothetical protein